MSIDDFPDPKGLKGLVFQLLPKPFPMGIAHGPYVDARFGAFAIDALA